MPRQRAQQPAPDEPGMGPDGIRKFGAKEPAPDEPGSDEAEGHIKKFVRSTEPAPDEPGADMDPDEARSR